MTVATQPARSGFLGGLADQTSEAAFESLDVAGTLPGWLGGSLYRNGPARFDLGSDRYRHWFDGLAMIHRFTISSGNVSYANRYLRTPAYEAAQRHVVLGGFGSRPRANGWIERARAIFRDRPAHNANVNVVPFSETSLVAMTETPTRVAFNAVSLETEGLVEYRDTVKGHTITAHPHHDAAKKTSVNLMVEFGNPSKYHIVSLPDGGTHRTTIGSIAVNEPSYMHSFATTERYAIVVEFPLVVRPLDLMFGGRAFVDHFRWLPERGTRFSVMRKNDGTIVRRYQSDACYAFHHVNAYEEGDAIVLDMSTYRDASVIDDLRMDRLTGPTRSDYCTPSLRRYRLEPGRDTCSYETLSQQPAELPRLNPRNLARTYRYAYGLGNDNEEPSPIGCALVKVDVLDRVDLTWREPGTYPGEPVFVSRPDATEEDDGAVLSVVFDATAETSFLLVLDARTFREIARASVPQIVPIGFHGTFVRA